MVFFHPYASFYQGSVCTSYIYIYFLTSKADGEAEHGHGVEIYGGAGLALHGMMWRLAL